MGACALVLFGVAAHAAPPAAERVVDGAPGSITWTKSGAKLAVSPESLPIEPGDHVRFFASTFPPKRVANINGKCKAKGLCIPVLGKVCKWDVSSEAEAHLSAKADFVTADKKTKIPIDLPSTSTVIDFIAPKKGFITFEAIDLSGFEADVKKKKDELCTDDREPDGAPTSDDPFKAPVTMKIMHCRSALGGKPTQECG
jgi:hypothetical protein